MIQGEVLDDNEDSGPVWSDRDYTYDEVNIRRIDTVEHSVIMKILVCGASCRYSQPDIHATFQHQIDSLNLRLGVLL